MKTVLTNAAYVVTCDDEDSLLRDVDIVVENGMILALGPNLSGSAVDEVVDCTGCIVYPGLINTHHHFFQAFVRNRADLAWPCDVLSWIEKIYPIFALLTEECFYHTTLINAADLIKHGCTTAFDHQYCFPDGAGKYLIDQQFTAAQQLGLRFNAGRGANTLPNNAGGNMPDSMVESTDAFLTDCERIYKLYHQSGVGAMQQITIAPCQPINCCEETFVEAIALARQLGVTLHTHLGEGESDLMALRHGSRTLDWCEKVGFFGSDTWVAHAWELSRQEISRLGELDIGVSHCPAPVFLVGEAVTDLPSMRKAGVRIGLGVDGNASNDNANLAECIRTAYLLQCLVANKRGHAPPVAKDYLYYATRGGAALLGRKDLGQLAPGFAADLFCLKLNRLETVGVEHDPGSLLAKVGLGREVDMTMINGRIVWQDGEFPGLDEAQMTRNARQVLSQVVAVH